MTAEDDRHSNYVSLQTHFEKLLEDRDKVAEAAYEEVQRRLKTLNGLHEEMRRRDASFYSKESHDDYANRVQEQISNISREIISRTETPRYAWLPALGAILVALSGIWYLAEKLTTLEANQSAMSRLFQYHDDRLATPLRDSPPIKSGRSHE